MVDAEAVRGRPFGGFAPGRIGSVVEDRVDAKFAENFGFAVGACSGDDAGAGGFGELFNCWRIVSSLLKHEKNGEE